MSSNLKSKYNLTDEDFVAALEAQDFACAICQEAEGRLREDGTPVRLSVDHCHRTGRVGLLLCSSCNLAIGHMKDNPAIALAIAEYLKLHRPKC